MAIESVKMGRIPKKLKEKALRDYQKQQERTLQRSAEENQFPEFSSNNNNENDDDDDDAETEVYEVDCTDAKDKRHSVSSLSSSSSSSMYAQPSTDAEQDIIIIPPGTSIHSPRKASIHFWPNMFILPLEMRHRSEQSLRTVDLIELTISASNNYVGHPNNNLSSLRLPNIFYDSHPPTESVPNKPNSSVSLLKANNHTKESNDGLSASETSKSDTSMTVFSYVANLNQKCVVDYMFGCEIRYSKNVLQMMKYLAPKLSQPFLIYELDFEVSSFFRYIRWKMFNCYLKHTQRIQSWVERMFGIINLGVSVVLLQKRSKFRDVFRSPIIPVSMQRVNKCGLLFKRAYPLMSTNSSPLFEM